MYEKHEEYKEVDAKKCLITENLEYYEKLYNNLLQEKENERNNIKRNIRYDERCARPCKDPRYNSEYNIKSKNEITEFTTWGVLYFWATRNKNHPLLNGLSCAEWANQFLLTPIEPKLFQHKKDSICELRTTLKSGGFLFSLQRFDLKIQMRLSHSNFKRSIPQRRLVPSTRCF